jgi:ParB-like chromosome segregation protein Spo0J
MERATAALTAKPHPDEQRTARLTALLRLWSAVHKHAAKSERVSKKKTKGRMADGPILTDSRYLNTFQAAYYVSRTLKGLRHLVARRRVPFTKPHGRLLFDRLKLDRWLQSAAVEAV